MVFDEVKVEFLLSEAIGELIPEVRIFVIMFCCWAGDYIDDIVVDCPDRTGKQIQVLFISFKVNSQCLYDVFNVFGSKLMKIECHLVFVMIFLEFLESFIGYSTIKDTEKDGI